MTTGAQLDERSLIASRYRVERTLGRGGMAEVYRVLDERSGKHLALKRCWSRDPTRHARHAALLEREYHTLAQLAHPHIVEVFDYGLDQRGPYYTMELLEGDDLGRVDRLGWKDTCSVLRDIASSLAILHSRGLIHRDVALRNVHRDATGSAKLFDFGAMTTMGVSKDLVGTPPFMAPEVLQLQGLDARVDLYSLGAVAYRLLTGRHAYPARRFSELRDVWRSKPQPPATLDPSVPVELSRLILRLLSLDRAGRPQSAAEVIEKLNTIADLPRENVAEITRGYLTTPTLVGRDSLLLEVRRRMLSLIRGDGNVLLVEGRAGSGRSRLLDACSLEAKLLAVMVVRTDARDASGGDWGVARAIGAQLLQLFPGHAFEAARLSREIIGHVIEELQPDVVTMTATRYEPERSLLIRELRDWILSFAKLQRLMIVVDDADQIDGPSAALLSALANKVERNPLMLAVAVERDAEHAASAPLRLLCDLATPISLEDLLPHDTDALIRSLFGDAPHVDVCAARIHGLSNGNPRTTIELAQHLVDTGRAHYERGSWILPRVLDEADLPQSLAASLASRLQTLSEDARELAGTLALADGAALRQTSYPALTSHRDSKRAFRALDALVAARILSADAERYSFVQRGFLAVLQDSMSEAQRMEAHLRIARELAADGDPLRRAEHLLAAGSNDAAIDLLCKLDLNSGLPSVSLLATAIERAEQLGRPAAILHHLRMALLVNAPFSMAADSIGRVAPVALRQLERDSGLARYRELAHLPEAERLTQALTLTQQAYQATPEHERVHSVIEAIRELAHLCGSLTAMAVATFDIDLLETLPALDPLFPLSPTLRIVSLVVEGARNWLHGRLQHSKRIYEQILTRIAEPDRAGLEESQYFRVRYGIEHALGMLDARWGSEAAEDRAGLLEERSEMRVNAWRIRALMQAARGNILESRRCSRRAELLEAQNGPKERYTGSTIAVMTVICARMGDVMSVKALLPPLAALAAKHPGWVPNHLLGRGCYRWLLRDLTGALALLERAIEFGPPGRWGFFGACAGVRIRVLDQLGRREEAVALARGYLQLCREQDLESSVLGMDAAIALSNGGFHEEAFEALRPAFAEAADYGAKGLALGGLYEASAWVALGTRDMPRFESFLESCANEYAISRNPNLGARVAAVIEEARDRGLYPSEASLPLPPSIQPTPINTEADTIHSRIVECLDASDRARCALTLLLQSTSSSTGFLYGTGTDRTLKLLAAIPDVPTDPGLTAWVERCARSWVEVRNLDEITISASEDNDETLSAEVGTLDEISIHYVDVDARPYTAIPLYDARGNSRCLAAVFVLEVSMTESVRLSKLLTTTIARELIEHEDAGGWMEAKS